jgi:histidinol dehydrogenase
MISIKSVEEAKKTILRRFPLHLQAYSSLTLSRTETLFGEGTTPPLAVKKILTSIDNEGDKAIRYWSKTIDNFNDHAISVNRKEIENAYNQLPKDIKEVMKRSAIRIKDFHSKQPINSWMDDNGLGQRVTPIEKIGVYVPGGTAPLPSSLLMSVIPAQVAGVKEIIICTPPNPDPSILAAANICGEYEVFQIGGAQAIAAMAFGTKTVPKVDKIVGAGNLFVTLAKQQLYGYVGIDGLAGPTETMIIADESANPAWVAADLLAQAEHDVQASAILLTTNIVFAEKVNLELGIQLDKLSRKDIISTSLKEKGGIVIVDSLSQAAEIANDYAAEHLCLSVDNPNELMNKINNAGGFFLGDHSYEVLGDYVAGPSHVMPTGGTARFSSPLNLLDFVKISSVISLDKSTATALSQDAAEFANAENLTAHAAAASARIEANL